MLPPPPISTARAKGSSDDVYRSSKLRICPVPLSTNGTQKKGRKVKTLVRPAKWIACFSGAS